MTEDIHYHYIQIINALMRERDLLISKNNTLYSEVERLRIDAGVQADSPPSTCMDLEPFDIPDPSSDNVPPAPPAPSPVASISDTFENMVVDGRCKCGYMPRYKKLLTKSGWNMHRQRCKKHRDYLSSYVPKSS